MQQRRVRRARKQHRCDGIDCNRVIKPGELYLSHIASPNHGDLGNLGWWRLLECADCAAKYGRSVNGGPA